MTEGSAWILAIAMWCGNPQKDGAVWDKHFAVTDNVKREACLKEKMSCLSIMSTETKKMECFK